MTELKPGWKRVKFGQVVRQVKEKVDPKTAGLERFVAGEHMDTDDLRIRRWGDIGDGYLGPAFHMRFRSGHVLYGSRRTYLRKVAVSDFDGICANTTFVLESADPRVLLPELLPFIMSTEAFHEHSKRESKGSVNPYVNFSDLEWFEFALPPLEEQRRACELLRAAESTLSASFMLTNASDVQLKSIVDDIVNKAFINGDLQELDGLIEPGRPVTYGILMPGTGFAGGVPVVKVRDYPNGFIEADNLLLTDPKIDAAFSRSRLRTGDLLISIRGTVGRLAFVPESLDGANITQDTARLSFASAVNPVFIKAALGSSPLSKQIRTHTTGLAVQGLNIGALRKLRIPVPSRRAQDAAAEMILEADRAVAIARERQEQARKFKTECLRLAMPEVG
jgi:type I restriction enzyme S subunit